MAWFLPLLLTLLPQAEAQAPAGDRAAGWLAGVRAELQELYQDLHAHPELAFHEERTASRMARILEEAGFAVTTGVGGHGVVGVLRNGEGSVVLVRTDMDALPIVERTGLPFASTVRTTAESGEVGVMHACGHDLHMTVWAGTARFLAGHRELWQGTLLFVAQPAEERGAGARAMLEDGLYERFARPDWCLALHVDPYRPAGVVSYSKGPAFANVDSVDILVRGKGGHGSAPHTTRDPVVLAARIVLGLQTLVSRELDPQEPGVVTVGSIHGGTRHNIIPDEVRLQLTVRSYTEAARRLLLDGIRRTARYEALAAGMTEEQLPEVVVREDEHTPAAFNDPVLVERVNAAMVRILGAERVQERPPVMGGEDFGRYAPAAGCPGYMFWLGTADPEAWQAARGREQELLPGLHTATYAPRADLATTTGVRAMAGAVLELLGRR